MKSRQTFAVFALVLGLVVFSGSAFARSDIGVKGIGFRVGYVDPSDSYDGTVGFGLLMDLGTFARNVHWDLAGYYWQTSQTYFYPGYYSRDWTLRDFALKSNVTYHFVNGEWEPYVGGGLGLHFFSWDFNYPPNYPHNWNASSTNLGLQLVGGVEHKFNSRWSGHGELEIDFTDTNQLHLQLGAVYMLGH